LIKRLLEAGFSENADQLVEAASKLWPEKEPELRKLRKTTVRRAA
jgi:hypothetical protein